MGIFNQFKEAHEAMKNMSPDEIRQMMDQAKETQKMLDDMIEKKVEAMIKDKDLVSRDEVKKMIER
jgi:polyhydroxyalkanoate synthesis regulator phasin